MSRSYSNRAKDNLFWWLFWVQDLSGIEKTIVHITKSTYLSLTLSFRSVRKNKPVCHIYPEHTAFQTWSSLRWKNKYITSYTTILARYSMLYYSSLQLGIQKGKKGEKRAEIKKKKLEILILSLKPSRAVRDYKKHLKPLTKCFPGIGTETKFS